MRLMQLIYIIIRTYLWNNKQISINLIDKIQWKKCSQKFFYNPGKFRKKLFEKNVLIENSNDQNY